MTGTTVQITRPEKVLYPDAGVTKRDLAEYFDVVAEVMLPHPRERPLVLNRFPDGLDGECPPGRVDLSALRPRDQGPAPEVGAHAIPDGHRGSGYQQRIANRDDRIFLDVARHGYAQTAVAPYSPRAMPGAPVATPIEFGELGRIAPAQHNLASVRR